MIHKFHNLTPTILGSSDWTPHKVELAVWTFYILQDLKPEVLDDLPSATKSVSASDRVENQINEGAEDDTDDTKITPSAKPSTDQSEDSSSSTESSPQNKPESHIESDPSTVIPPTNGQGTNELSNNHRMAADSGGTLLASSAKESNDAKAQNKLDEGYNGNQLKESDLNSKKVASEQNVTPIMTNGKDTSAETSEHSSSQKNHDVQLSPASLTPQTTNGTHGNDAKTDETSKLRLQPEDTSVNVVPANGNSKNGTLEVI